MVLLSSYISVSFSQDSITIINGLAVYKTAKGEPVLLMPYPHASTYHSMIENPLVEILNDLGFSVLTFDPPGIFQSNRQAKVDLDEMLSCTNEILDYFKIKDSIIVVGHSQSGFCSIAFTIEFPRRIKKLILIGSVSGWPVVKKTSIHKQYSWTTKERWQMMYWGTKKMLNLSNLYIHRKLDQMVHDKSFINKTYVEKIPVDKKDKRKPEPVRAKWMVNMRKDNYDYSTKLDNIKVPTLICVGEYDPQTPVQANMELKKEIKKSSIKIFKQSGHSPFIEEKGEFILTLKEWLK